MVMKGPFYPRVPYLPIPSPPSPGDAGTASFPMGSRTPPHHTRVCLSYRPGKVGSARVELAHLPGQGPFEVPGAGRNRFGSCGSPHWKNRE